MIFDRTEKVQHRVIKVNIDVARIGKMPVLGGRMQLCLGTPLKKRKLCVINITDACKGENRLHTKKGD